jgi:hypothetical protein
MNSPKDNFLERVAKSLEPDQDDDILTVLKALQDFEIKTRLHQTKLHVYDDYNYVDLFVDLFGDSYV